MTSKKEIKKEIKYEKNRLKELDRKRIEKQKATGDYIYTPAIIKLARKIIRGSEAKKNVMGKVNSPGYPANRKTQTKKKKKND